MRRYRLQSWVLAFLCAATLTILGYNYLAEFTHQTYVYYNSGPILDQAMRLTRGENIYPHGLTQPPFTVNNYGPLYFLLQYPLLSGAAPTLLFGNVISLISHLLSACFAALIIQHLTQNRVSAIITGILVLASPFAGGYMPLYRVDQLAQVLSLAGIYAGITSTSRRGDIATALLFCAAIYSKLTYGLAGPATVFFYHILQGSQKRAFSQATTLVALSSTLFILGESLTGGFVFNLITANSLEYSIVTALKYLGGITVLSVGAVCIITHLREKFSVARPARQFFYLYLCFAILVAMASGKSGANASYFSELQIAVAFLFGIAASAP
jgi:hypothetical protein